MQCLAAARKGQWVGREAEAGYRLCEKALAIDADNVFALTILPVKFYTRVAFGFSTDPQADLTRADELVSRALTIDSSFSWAHSTKGFILLNGKRFEDAIAEFERSVALDPNLVHSYAGYGRCQP